MSKPLIASKEAKEDAARWHRAVFALFGHVCVLHRYKDPKSKMTATDAAHVIKRSRLGTALAYVSPRLGRPLCRECHRAQELGLDEMFFFPWRDVCDAIQAHNEVAKAKFEFPDPWKDAWK